MASVLLSTLSSTIIPALVIFSCLFVDSASSTYRRALRYKEELPSPAAGFCVTLHHIDAGKNLTKFERIQHSIKRGKKRLQTLNAAVLAADSSGSTYVEAPTFAGSGEYLMNLAIGTPPKSYSAVLDTGSDLIWTQCQPCTNCYPQPTPIFDPNKSSSFSKISCSSSLCAALPASQCDDGCQYVYSYGDYSMTQGIMATETFTFGDNKVSIPSIGFGCGADNEGAGFSQSGGLVGLGRGPLSFVSQLKESKFSYCLTPMDETKTSKLLMGSVASVNDTPLFTSPMITNRLHPTFYYLSLEGISVGGKRLPIKKSNFQLNDDGTGGIIIDSGTTLTYLEQEAYDSVKNEFMNQVKLSVDTSGSAGLDLCFKLSEGDSSELAMPKLVFHFEGGDYDMPFDNYMVRDSDVNVVCLALGPANGMSIFGNIQQQNILVFHDLAKETVSFYYKNCDQL